MDRLTYTPPQPATHAEVRASRRAALKLRIKVWQESADFGDKQAKGCREARCLRSAEYWQRDADKAREYIKMAQHELEQLGG